MTKKIKLKISHRLLKKRFRKQTSNGVKHCRFVNNPEMVAKLDYKNVDFLRSFLTERGKILPLRISGNSAKYQRLVSTMIKRARIMGLLPYTSSARV
jgi:small subunit ribosomal protein S18